MMFLNNLMDDRQAKPRSFVFSALVFGRKKRVEYVFEIRILDSFSGIFDLDVGPDLPSRLHYLTGLDAQASSRCCHRGHGIEEKIEQDLLDLLPVQHDTR